MSRVLWSTQAKARLVNSSENSEILVSPMGVLSKGKVLGNGRVLITSAVEEVILGAYDYL